MLQFALIQLGGGIGDGVLGYRFHLASQDVTLSSVILTGVCVAQVPAAAPLKFTNP